MAVGALSWVAKLYLAALTAAAVALGVGAGAAVGCIARVARRVSAYLTGARRGGRPCG